MSYYQIATFFTDRNQQQLRALAKIIGMELFERLTQPSIESIQGLSRGKALSCREIRKDQNSLVRYLALNRMPVVLSENEIEAVDSEFLGLGRIRSIMSAPLVVKGNTLAVLTFYSNQSGNFNAQGLEFFRNITNQVAIAIYNAQLFETVKSQALELEKSNETKDEFLGVVSHELRTPLNVILGYLRLLQDNVLGELNEEQSRALTTASKHSDDLLEMIESIMETTRIQVGEARIQNRSVDLISLLDDLSPVTTRFPGAQRLNCLGFILLICRN